MAPHIKTYRATNAGNFASVRDQCDAQGFPMARWETLEEWSYILETAGRDFQPPTLKQVNQPFFFIKESSDPTSGYRWPMHRTKLAKTIPAMGFW